MSEINKDLLAFAEYVANHRSGNLHGFHHEVVSAARRVVKAAGGRLDKIGRYEKDSAVSKPFEKHVGGGRWVHPVLDRATDTWSYPKDV
jgi:hypothetical protein